MEKYQLGIFLTGAACFILWLIWMFGCFPKGRVSFRGEVTQSNTVTITCQGWCNAGVVYYARVEDVDTARVGKVKDSLRLEAERGIQIIKSIK